MKTCIACSTRPANFDERFFCTICARALGMISESHAERMYDFLLGVGLKTIDARLISQKEESPKPIQATSLSIISSPTLHYNNARRLLYQNRLYDKIKHLEGDIVECGVGNGETFINWCVLIQDNVQLRNIWSFDSFEGFPEPTPEDEGFVDSDSWKPMGRDMLQLFYDSLFLFGLPSSFIQSQVTIVKGFFKETLKKYTGDKIALLHLDCDLYESYKDSLEALSQKVVDGGIIALDEYMGTMENFNYPGAKQAIDEWLEEHNRYTMQRDKLFGKYYLVKHDIGAYHE